MDSNNPLKTFKGFGKDLKCRDFQYEDGAEYRHDGNAVACRSGFHACEYPMDVFGYYPPSKSVYHEVEQSGEICRHEDDTKVASSVIKIGARIDIPHIVKASFEYVLERCKKEDSAHTEGDSSASSATGDSSASSATGYRSASSATGDRSASSATGYSSASSATGYSSASLSTGWLSSSEIREHESAPPLHAVAIATGESGAARAPMSSAIVLCYRNDDGELLHIRASKVGENGIKPNVWYSLDESGEFVEAD